MNKSEDTKMHTTGGAESGHEHRLIRNAALIFLALAILRVGLAEASETLEVAHRFWEQLAKVLGI